MTVSSLLGGIGLNVSSPLPPGSGSGPLWPDPPGVGRAWAAPPATPPPAAAAPTTSAPNAPARSSPRRDNSLATSPKYALSEVFGASWAQALPHRYRQVMALRPEW